MTEFIRRWEVDYTRIDADIKALDSYAFACFERAIHRLETDHALGKPHRSDGVETIYLLTQQFITLKVVTLRDK